MTSMRAVAGLCLLLAVAGCGAGGGGRVDGPVLTSAGGSGDAMTAIVAGRLGFQDGCLLLGESPVVWPQGTRWDAGTQSLTLPGGDAVGLGARLSGAGGYLPIEAVTDLFGDEVAAAARPCLGSTGEVAVFNPGSEVEAVP